MEPERANTAGAGASPKSGTQNTAREILGIIEHLVDCYPKAKITQEAARTMAAQLEEYEPSRIRQAVKQIIHNSKFFPAISEIIKASRPLADMADPDRMRHTRLHASMCLGMDESEVEQYLENCGLTRYDVDIPYLKAYVARNEMARNRELAKQWPKVYGILGKLRQ